MSEQWSLFGPESPVEPSQKKKSADKKPSPAPSLPSPLDINDIEEDVTSAPELADIDETVQQNPETSDDKIADLSKQLLNAPLPKDDIDLRAWVRDYLASVFQLGPQARDQFETALFSRISALKTTVVPTIHPKDTPSSEIDDLQAPRYTTTPGETRAQVLALKSAPETKDWSLAQLAAELGVSRVTVHKHIHKLKRDGLL